jgi:hypothetical protein
MKVFLRSDEKTPIIHAREFAVVLRSSHMTHWVNISIRRAVASIVFGLAMSVASASANPILSLDTVSADVDVNDVVELQIRIDDAVDLFSFSFYLLFNQDILTFESADEGSFPQDGLPPFSTFFIAGLVPYPNFDSPTEALVVGNTILGPDLSFSGSGVVATARFVAHAAGTSFFSLEEPVFVPSAVPDEPSAMIVVVAAFALAFCRSFTRAS